MALAFGATIHDGRYTKIFTVTALDNDAVSELAIVFDGAGGRPTAFCAADVRPSGAPIEATVTRTEPGNGGGAASEFGCRALTATGVTVRKYTSSGAGAAISVRVVVRAISPSDR